MPILLILGAIGSAFGLGYLKASESSDDAPVTVDERKGARTKWIIGLVAAVAIWAFFRGHGK